MKHILVLLLVFSTVQSLKAQYKPFNLDSGRWYTLYSTKGGMFGGGDHQNYYAIDSIKFYCDGDTIINATTFKKLMYVGNTRSQAVPLTPVSGYYGAIRNDEPNKRVYLLPSNSTVVELVLYDFNVSIGDSIPVSYEYFNDKEPVSQIDSVLYCGTYHKRYSSASGYNIIEGVGSLHGMIPVKFATDLGTRLCYQELGNGVCTECSLALSLDAYSQNQLIVFPNPANGSVRIVTDLNIRSIEVYDLTGTLVSHLDEYNGVIKLNNKGCYFLKISTDSEVFVRKLVNE